MGKPVLRILELASDLTGLAPHLPWYVVLAGVVLILRWAEPGLFEAIRFRASGNWKRLILPLLVGGVLAAAVHATRSVLRRPRLLKTMEHAPALGGTEWTDCQGLVQGRQGADLHLTALPGSCRVRVRNRGEPHDEGEAAQASFGAVLWLRNSVSVGVGQDVEADGKWHELRVTLTADVRRRAWCVGATARVADSIRQLERIPGNGASEDDCYRFDKPPARALIRTMYDGLRFAASVEFQQDSPADDALTASGGTRLSQSVREFTYPCREITSVRNAIGTLDPSQSGWEVWVSAYWWGISVGR